MANARPKLLFVTRTSPFAGESGSGTYVFALLRYLAGAGFEIRVVWTASPDLNPTGGWYAPPPESRAVFSLRIADTLPVGRRFWKPDVVWLPLKARGSYAIKTVLQRLGLWRKRAASTRGKNAAPSANATAGWGAPTSPTETAFVRQAISRWRPDVVLANYSWMGRAVSDRRGGNPPMALLTHDVRHRKIMLVDGVATERLGEFLDPQVEIDQLSVADLLVAIQDNEAAYFRRLLPGCPVLTATMSVDPRPQPPGQTPTLLMVGSDNGENLRSLGWFLEQVWPAVLASHPRANLLVAGTLCRMMPPSLPPGVSALGMLPDLTVAYRQAAVVIAPVLAGSGVKIKVLEAVAHGRACVTTSVGVDGLEFLQPHVLVADTPDQFASAIHTLLSDPARAEATGQASLDTAREKLSAQACFGPLAEGLKKIIR